MNDKQYKSLFDEIRRFVDHKINTGQPALVSWVTTEILARKSEVVGSDAPFYLFCARSVIHDIVKRVIGKYNDQSKPGGEKDEQIVLPGFEHLQRAYTVKRADEITLVPIEQLSDKELLARADEYDAMAAGCLRHAFEIRRYVKARSEVAA